MSKIEVIVTPGGLIRFSCDCLNSGSGPLCPECQDRVWLRIGQLVNQEKPPLISGMEGENDG